MSIKDRLRRLETGNGSCSECGNAPPAIHAFYPDEEEPEPDSFACPKCGRALGVVVRVVYEGEGEE